MTESNDHGNAVPADGVTPADAELADAMNSIEAIGEDWRSSERATDDSADGRKNDDPENDSSHDNEERDDG